MYHIFHQPLPMWCSGFQSVFSFLSSSQSTNFLTVRQFFPTFSARPSSSYVNLITFHFHPCCSFISDQFYFPMCFFLCIMQSLALWNRRRIVPAQRRMVLQHYRYLFSIVALCRAIHLWILTDELHQMKDFVHEAWRMELVWFQVTLNGWKKN